VKLRVGVLALLFCTCHESPAPPAATAAPRPSILLVTLDTTRADAIGDATPSFNALAARGLRFTQAYCTTPQTLPSHSSMLTGLYPPGHGIHENGRYLAEKQPVIAELVKNAGYDTAAFVSAFALARRFGLARGFDVYDDEPSAGLQERSARETTDRALAWLAQRSSKPRFLWVHYYEPHYPYTPPEPYRTRFAKNPYLGEVAAMDEQLGRLLAAFDANAGAARAIIIAGDHGEGLGEHGEAQHGNLMYQSTMHVPLVIAGPGVTPGTNAQPVSTRRIFHTIRDWAGLGDENSLRRGSGEVVVAEAMKPFLDYGWQPQMMAVEARQKTIRAGALEVYDVVADPHETHNLAPGASLSRDVRAALRDYPVPSADAAAPPPSAMSSEDQKKLAALGYVGSTVAPVVRADAPRPADMTALFPLLDEAAGLFVREQYAAAIPLLEKIVAADPHNLEAILRLATSHSELGHDAQAVAAYERARAVAPQSQDVQTYFALHYARTKEWQKAEPMLEAVLAQSPERVPALEALAAIREREGRFADALALRQKVAGLRAPTPAELVHTGTLAMQLGQTPVAIDAFERARAAGAKVDLELGVLYLADRRLDDARASLDRVPPSSEAYPMALFKRAQVSVLLREPDAPVRIATARAHANAMTRELIARERLFQ
jgi:choline-sulfatase